MKLIKNSMILASLLMLGTLSSFKPVPGGDSFQIYLNGKLVLDKALYKNKDVQSLEFVQASSSDKVEVYYSHCGKTGTARSITIKDDGQKTLKTWSYADGGKNMSLQLQDLRNLQTSYKESHIGLFYSSKELPSGQQLAEISITGKSLASR